MSPAPCHPLTSSVSVAELWNDGGEGRGTMSTESAAGRLGGPAQRIADGYAVEGQALELGTVVVDGAADPTAQIRIPLATINRHGLVAGATGTGKTKTLQLIAEQLSAPGGWVPMADVNGALSGPARRGQRQDRSPRQSHRRQLGSHGVPGGILVAGHRRSGRADTGDHCELRPGSV